MTITEHLDYLDRWVDLQIKRLALRRAIKIAKLKCATNKGKTYWILRDLHGSLRVVNKEEINILTAKRQMARKYRSHIERDKDAAWIVRKSDIGLW